MRVLLIIQNEVSGDLNVSGVYRVRGTVEALMRQLDPVLATYNDAIVGWVQV